MRGKKIFSADNREGIRNKSIVCDFVCVFDFTTNLSLLCELIKGFCPNPGVISRESKLFEAGKWNGYPRCVVENVVEKRKKREAGRGY